MGGLLLFSLSLIFLICKSSQVPPPIQPYQKCLYSCRGLHDYQQIQRCEHRCQEDYGSEHNPFVFGEESFDEVLSTQDGWVRVLKRFSQMSSLLLGLDDYRLMLLEANASTFTLPVHFDAQTIIYVLRGRGIINLIHQDNSESYNIRCGDVIRVRPGTMVILINTDNEQKLNIAHFLKSTSIPGQFELYRVIGGINPYYRAFSDKILKTAFNIPTEKVEKLFRKQTTGAIKKASQEQITAFSRHVSKEMGLGSPFNLLCNLTYGSELGLQYRISPSHHKPIQDLGLSVAYTNISQGAMTTPFYNFEETAVILVVQGSGWMEIVSPYVSKQAGTYTGFTTQLSPMNVLVIPQGHSAVIVASDQENLHILTFGITGGENQRGYLAGENNILKLLQKEARELSFEMEAEEVDLILNSQKKAYFLPGPNKCQK